MRITEFFHKGDLKIEELDDENDKLTMMRYVGKLDIEEMEIMSSGGKINFGFGHFGIDFTRKEWKEFLKKIIYSIEEGELD